MSGPRPSNYDHAKKLLCLQVNHVHKTLLVCIHHWSIDPNLTLFCWPFGGPNKQLPHIFTIFSIFLPQIIWPIFRILYNICEGLWWIGIPWGTCFGANGCATSTCFTNPKHDWTYFTIASLTCWRPFFIFILFIYFQSSFIFLCFCYYMSWHQYRLIATISQMRTGPYTNLKVLQLRPSPLPSPHCIVIQFLPWIIMKKNPRYWVSRNISLVYI